MSERALHARLPAAVLAPAAGQRNVVLVLVLKEQFGPGAPLWISPSITSMWPGRCTSSAWLDPGQTGCTCASAVH